MDRKLLITGAALAGLAVALGAFGAHKLKAQVPPETVATFQTGVQYQMYHAIALLVTGILSAAYAPARMRWAGFCFIAGIVLFSGSLYFLTAMKATATVGLEGVGIITPFGGLFFIAGWICLVAGLVSGKPRQ